MNRNHPTAYLTRVIALSAVALCVGSSFAASPSPSSSPSTASATPASTPQACTVTSPRDMATGQASGKRQHGAMPHVRASEQCDDSNTALRESPSKASLGKSKELTGHVTLMK